MRMGWHGLLENTTIDKFLKNEDLYNKNNPFYPNWEIVFVDNVNQNKIDALNFSNTKI